MDRTKPNINRNGFHNPQSSDCRMPLKCCHGKLCWIPKRGTLSYYRDGERRCGGEDTLFPPFSQKVSSSMPFLLIFKISALPFKQWNIRIPGVSFRFQCQMGMHLSKSKRSSLRFVSGCWTVDVLSSTRRILQTLSPVFSTTTFGSYAPKIICSRAVGAVISECSGPGFRKNTVVNAAYNR